MSRAVRLLPTYVLTGIPIATALRAAPAYVLVGETKRAPTGLTGKQAVFNLILQNTSVEFDIEDFYFSLPKVIEEGDKNTEVTLYPKASTEYTGKITFQYNRLPLDNLFLNSPVEITDEVTAYDLIDALINASGVLFGQDDLEETLVGEESITLIAGPCSYFFIPGTLLTVSK